MECSFKFFDHIHASEEDHESVSVDVNLYHECESDDDSSDASIGDFHPAPEQ